MGPLSFIGLMTPHLATSLGAVQLEKQLPLAALLGAGVMMLADWIGRYVISLMNYPQEQSLPLLVEHTFYGSFGESQNKNYKVKNYKVITL